jgi:hypothetical protein
MTLPAPWRGLLLAAGLILSGTAILHGIAYPMVTASLKRAGFDDSWGPELSSLWVMFALHLVIIAGFLVIAAARPQIASDSALFICALLLAADTALLGGYLGLFGGTLLLAVATALVIIARVLRQQNPTP